MSEKNDPEMESQILKYTVEMNKIADMLNKIKRELKKREGNLKNLEDKINESEKKLKEKIDDIDEKDRRIKELERKISQKMEELKIQERELRINSALEYLTFESRERELKSKEDSIKKVGLEEVQKQIEDLKEKLKEKEEIIEELLIKGGKGGGEASGKISTERENKLMELKEELKKKEKELKLKEEEIAKREREVMSHVKESDKNLSEILEERQAQLERLAKELKEKREEVSNDYRRLSELERSLKAKEAELRMREGSLSIAASEKGGSSDIDIEEVRKKIESEANTRVQMLENFYKQKINALLKKIEDMEARNADLVMESDQLAQDKMRVTLMERELRERINELAFQEERLSHQQEMLIKERKKIDEEKKKVQEIKGKSSSVALIEKVREQEKLLKETERRLKEKEEFLRKKEEELRALEGKVIDQGIAIEEEVERQKTLTKCRTGIRRFDDLMIGGLPFNSNFILYGPAYSGRRTFLNIFIAEGLKRGIPAIYITTELTPEEVRGSLRLILPKVESYEKKGILKYIDIYSKPMGLKIEDPYTIFIDKPTELDKIKDAVYKIQQEFQTYPYHRIVIYSASTLLAYVKPMEIFRFFQTLNAKNKLMNAVAIYALDYGMHEPAVIQTLKHVMSGFIEFQVSGQKYQLMVQGGGDVLSRSWIDYVYTNKSFDLRGSFALDHIK